MSTGQRVLTMLETILMSINQGPSLGNFLELSMMTSIPHVLHNQSKCITYKSKFNFMKYLRSFLSFLLLLQIVAREHLIPAQYKLYSMQYTIQYLYALSVNCLQVLPSSVLPALSYLCLGGTGHHQAVHPTLRVVRILGQVQ